MSPEQIKELEIAGARKILIDKMIETADKLSEVCGKYARIQPNSWGATKDFREHANEIKLHSATINTLINHLESGT